MSGKLSLQIGLLIALAVFAALACAAGRAEERRMIPTQKSMTYKMVGATFICWLLFMASGLLP